MHTLPILFAFMRSIDSDKNILYRKLMAQGSARELKKTNWILIEGLRQIEEALQAGADLDYLVFSDDEKGESIRLRLEEKSADLLEQLDEDQLVLMRSDLFQRLAETKTPAGVLAVLQALRTPLEEIQELNSLVLIDVQDPGNVGTLIRSADAFAIKQVILLGASASPWLNKTLRAAMGSIFHVSIFEEKNTQAGLALLSQKGLRLLAMDTSGTDIRQVGLGSKNYGLILGNEANGLPEQVLKQVEEVIRIDMPGSAESLNVAIAGAIALYELNR